MNENYNKNNLDKFINSIPTPEELGLDISEYRINEYKKIMSYITKKYRTKIWAFCCIFFIAILIIYNSFSRKVFIDESFFIKYIIAPGILVLLVCIFFKLSEYIPDSLATSLAMQHFKRINEKEPLTEPVFLSSFINVQKFNKKELHQIESYINLENKYDAAKYGLKKMEKIKKESNN